MEERYRYTVMHSFTLKSIVLLRTKPVDILHSAVGEKRNLAKIKKLDLQIKAVCQLIKSSIVTNKPGFMRLRVWLFMKERNLQKWILRRRKGITMIKS